MGIYLNPGMDKFQMALDSPIYVDKTGLLSILNQLLRTDQRYVCVSRPRRFGKTMAANMISAYYDRTVQGDRLFLGLEIEQDSSFDMCRNHFDVLRINMQEFLSAGRDVGELLQLLKEDLCDDLHEEYPEISVRPGRTLQYYLQKVYQHTKRQFVIVIDEWDCVIREHQDEQEAQERYLDFLRDFLKDKGYVALAYMTGILPIKKYGTHSALNMFDEYSMTDPGPMAQYAGFTSDEVQELCERYRMDFATAKQWYDGYAFPQIGDIYSPRSVVTAMLRHKFGTYWNQTETFQALRVYIDLGLNGLRDDVICLIAGDRLRINTGTFSNDMTTFHTADDVLTLLIHLGYLAYDETEEQVYIPNKEVMMEFANAVSVGGWNEIARAIKASTELLRATWRRDEEAVAEGVANAHLETSQLTYHSETALAYTISLAYYAAREYYLCYRELPAGKGFADLVFVPRIQHMDKPAMVIELKWNKSAETAVRQIREKRYPLALKGHQGKIYLVGISYERKSKKHQCKIEVFDV